MEVGTRLCKGLPAQRKRLLGNIELRSWSESTTSDQSSGLLIHELSELKVTRWGPATMACLPLTASFISMCG